MIIFVAIRNFFIFIFGVWLFEFHIDYTFPTEENLLLYFVAIPIIWATLIQIWTTTSYKEQKNRIMLAFTHVMAILLSIERCQGHHSS